MDRRTLTLALGLALAACSDDAGGGADSADAATETAPPEDDTALGDEASPEVDDDAPTVADTEGDTLGDTDTTPDSTSDSTSDTTSDTTSADLDAPPPDPGPSSDQRIASALAAGSLDADTALVYRVYALVGDPRLPTEFRGTDSALDNLVLAEVAERFPGLRPETQALLVPFLEPPIYADSWYGRQHATEPHAGHARAAAAFDYSTLCKIRFTSNPVTGEGVDAIDGTAVRVWYETATLDPHTTDENRALAEKILSKLEGTILPAEQATIGRSIVSDANTFCNGDDGRLDVYLVRFRVWDPAELDGQAAGFIQPLPDKTAQRYLCDGQLAGAMVLHRDFLHWAESGARPGLLDFVLAHEVAHLFQDAFPAHSKCTDAGHWLQESTADFMAHEVYPQAGAPAPHHVHIHGYYYGQDSFLSLDDPSAASRHVYGFYLMSYWLAYGPAAVSNVLRKVFEAWGQSDDPFGAFESVMPGGWRGVWNDFTKELVNLAPHRFFDESDQFPYRPHWTDDTALELHGIREFELQYPGERILMPYLSHRFFRFAFPDEPERSIAIHNTFAPLGAGSADPDVQVTALRRLPDRTLEDLDWTAEEHPFICRSLKDERIDQLVLALGNRAWQNRGPDSLAVPETPFTITASNVHCGKWTGTITYHAEQTFSVPTDEGPISYHELIDYDADPTFTPVARAADLPAAVTGMMGPFLTALEKTGVFPRYYVVTSGELSYTHTVDVTGPGVPCSGTATGGAELASGLGFMAIATIGGPGKQGGTFAVGTAQLVLSETSSCGGPTTSDDHVTWLDLSFNPATGVGNFVSDDGLEIVGEKVATSANGSSRRTWHFDAVLEP